MGRVDRWYRNTIIYGVDVKTYQDSDGDGIGDFPGLISRLDYLRGLGVSCIWLLPCYPSPWRDNGYDIADYYDIDPRLGTLGDFVEFLRAANERGIEVIMDLVVNHTSDEHPWFQQARQDAESRFRDFYVWSDDPPPTPPGKENIFPGEESGVWTYDKQASSHYHHRFYSFQPTLNHANPKLRAEVEKILGFWLQLGVAGFRVDAAGPMIEAKGGLEESRPRDPHGILRQMREFVTLRRGDAVLLGEADEDPEEIGQFFGKGDELNLLFNFLLDNYLFLALARGEAEPLEMGLKLLPSVPPQGQWANFLRNLDELDLERLSDGQREDVYRAFAPKEEMRIYGRGIRRRLAPMLRNDRRWIEMALSLLCALPGCPVIVYGDEIGMGDDLSLEGRDAVRTVMQWSSDENAGFSVASPDALVRPALSGGAFGYERVNVADQERDPESLLNWVEHLFRIRRETPEIGQGEWSIIETAERGVLALRYDYEESVVITVHNFSRTGCKVLLRLREEEAAHMADLLGDRRYLPVRNGVHQVELEGHGYRWFRVHPRVQKAPER